MEKDKMAKIYDRWKNTVYRTALTYCRNISDAEDITQEVFITRFNTDKIFERAFLWLLRRYISCSGHPSEEYTRRTCEAHPRPASSFSVPHSGTSGAYTHEPYR